jgi:MFS family permease
MPASLSLLATSFRECATRDRVLGLNGALPFATGAALGIPGLVSVLSGVLAGRLIGRVGNVRLLVAGMTIQSPVTLPVAFAGTSRAALWVVVPCLFVGFFGDVAAIVSFVVTVTCGLADGAQGLATGLTSLTQLVADLMLSGSGSRVASGVPESGRGPGQPSPRHSARLVGTVRVAATGAHL